MVDHAPVLVPVHNLPHERTRLVGREREVAALTRLLRRDEIGLVTCTGPGGIGKTRLALQVGTELLATYADGVFLVALATVREPDQVVSAIVQTLNLRQSGGQPLLEHLQEHLRDKETLLLLDNFEQVLDAAGIVGTLLAHAPRLKILVTSREALHLHEEQEFPVPPLQLPDTHPLPPMEILSQFEAVALFIQRARAVQPAFQVTNDNAPAVAEICHRLDGLPLAIELAAARIKLFPPQALLARLQRRLTLLTGGARDRPLRQQALHATIAWSYDLLSADEQRLFRRLAVFAGGSTLEACAAVCNPATPTIPTVIGDILDVIAALVNKSLLRQQLPEPPAAEAEPRFGMLETIQEYAWLQLEQSGEAPALREQHAHYFLALAEAAEPGLKGQPQTRWLARLDAEHENLRAALLWTHEQNDAELGLRLAGALWRFWYIRGYYTEGRSQLAALLALGAASPSVRAATLHGAGVLAWGQGDYAAARTHSEASLALYRTLNDQAGIASALNTLGLAARSQGDYATARQLHTESLTIRRSLRDQWGIANTLLNLGVVAYEQDAYEEARQLLEESLVLDRALADVWSTAIVLDNLGLVIHSQGDPARAQALLEQSLALRRSLGDDWGAATALQHLALVSREQRRLAEAKALLDESLALYREVGDRNGIALVLCDLAHVAEVMGDYSEAQAQLKASLLLYQSADFAPGIAACLQSAARLASAQDQLRRAAHLWSAAAALREIRHAFLPGRERLEYERQVRAVRGRMDASLWARSWAEGQTLTVAEAVAAALAPEPEPVPPPTSLNEETPLAVQRGSYPGGLTEREVAVLRLVAEGLTNAQIAQELALSPHTVNVHLRTIYSKLNVPSRAAATRFAMDHKLL